jgi:hypothetical protein
MTAAEITEQIRTVVRDWGRDKDGKYQGDVIPWQGILDVVKKAMDKQREPWEKYAQAAHVAIDHVGIANYEERIEAAHRKMESMYPMKEE